MLKSTVKVLSKQPKRTGKNKDWVNVLVDGSDEPSSVNWQDVTSWDKVDEPEHVVLLSLADERRQHVIDAKEREFNNLVEHKVFDWVDDVGQKTISTKWVITEKETPDGGKKWKARLVARGFEENTDRLSYM